MAGQHACPTCGKKFASLKAQRDHARKTGHGPLPSGALRKLMKADPTCTWCGGDVDDSLPFDHVLRPTREHRIPKAEGGGSKGGNIALAHWLCNHIRGTMAEEGFRALMRGEAVTREQLWPELDRLLGAPRRADTTRKRKRRRVRKPRGAGAPEVEA